MSTPKPDSSQASDGPSAADASCRVKHVISTGAVFAATLDRLNRNSTLALVQALATEVEEHGKKLSSASSSNEEVQKLRGELLAFLGLLHKAMEQHQSEAALVKQQLIELQETSTQTQSEFESHLQSLIIRQIQQQLSSSVERDLKPLSVRLEQALSERKRTGWLPLLLLLLLLLLLGGGGFAIGLLTGRKSAPVVCPPAPAPACCAAPASPSASTQTSVQASGMLPLAQPVSAAASLAASRSKAQPPVATPEPMAGHNHTSATEEAATAAAVLARSAGVTAKSGKGSPHLEIAGFALQPNSMEAELLEFLQRPGARAPHLFIMDRLKYPTASHEVNPEGKEQIFLIAKILLAYPSVRIEIRGHNDGTESEEYHGPNPIPGYTLSQLRADCVLKRLMGLRVPSSRMRVRGLASTEPLAEDRTEEGRQLNRRVEIDVLY